MSVRGKDAVLLIVLTFVEIILGEVAIRSSNLLVERAASILFIGIGIAMVLMFGIGAHRSRGRYQANRAQIWLHDCA